MDIEGNVYESTKHYTTQARCGGASMFPINRTMVSFWGGADSATNNASAAIPTSLMTGWASRNWFIRTSNVQKLHIAFLAQNQTTFSSTVGSTCSRYNSRSRSFCSLPVAVCGSSSAKTMSSGFHHFTTLPS